LKCWLPGSFNILLDLPERVNHVRQVIFRHRESNDRPILWFNDLKIPSPRQKNGAESYLLFMVFLLQ
jgi:hypothetical protein